MKIAMNRWFFWVLAPIMLVTAVSLPFLDEPPTWQGLVVLYLVCGTLLLATLGLANTRRFRWALKCVAVAVLVAYSGYLASECWEWWHGKPFGFGSPRGRSTLFNAARGFVVFAIPLVIFLLRGRSGTAVDVLLSDESRLEDR